jgi:hypothetical protein
MRPNVFTRMGWWLCAKTGHLLYKDWIYNSYYHRDCKLCGRIISKRIWEKNT